MVFGGKIPLKGKTNEAVKLLSSANVRYQQDALLYIQNRVARGNSTHHVLEEYPSCLPGVVKLLSSSDPEVQSAAAQTVQALAEHSDRSSFLKQHIMTAALDGLLLLLRSSTDTRVLTHAAGALAVLMIDAPRNQQQFAAAPGGISKLVELLSSSAVAVRAAAAHALSACADMSASNQTRFTSEHPGAVTGLLALLQSPDPHGRWHAVRALFQMCSVSLAGAYCISKHPEAVGVLVSMLLADETDANAKAMTALLLARLAADSESVQQVLLKGAPSLWAALQHPAVLGLRLDEARLLSEWLQHIAMSSAGLRESMRDSAEARKLLQELQGRGDTAICEAASKALEWVDCDVVLCDTPSDKPAVGGSSTAPTKDTSGVRDQVNTAKPMMWPLLYTAGHPAGAHFTSPESGKLATVGEVLRWLLTLPKLVPVIGDKLIGTVELAQTVIKHVTQARINKSKARFLFRRIEALAAYLVAMFENAEELERALQKQPRQLAVVREQFTKLHEALEEAAFLLRKWSKPMGLQAATRFLKANLYKQDIEEVGKSLSEAVHDLTLVMSSIASAKTLALCEEREQQLSPSSFMSELVQAHQQDFETISGSLEQLVGGQEELQRQLAAASAETRMQWTYAASKLEEVAAGVYEVNGRVTALQRDVEQLTVSVQDWMQQGGDSSSGGRLLRSSLLLTPDRVRKLHRLDEGGFGTVYAGLFNSVTPVVVKQLDMSAFRGPAITELYYEAAVLARLRSPHIVQFYGLLVEPRGRPCAAGSHGDISSSPRPSALSSSLGSTSDSSCSRAASSNSTLSGSSFYSSSSCSTSSSSGRPTRGDGVDSFTGSIAANLVMEPCDCSLHQYINDEPPFDFTKHQNRINVLNIAMGISGGLKYLHQEAPIHVVHGDLKPANVLLKKTTDQFNNRHLSVKIADFGLSRTVAVMTKSQGAVQLCGQGPTAGERRYGTLNWTPPEIFQAWNDGAYPDHQRPGDIYAFGLVLYELITWKVPYYHVKDRERVLPQAVLKNIRPVWVNWEAQLAAAPELLQGLRKVAEDCWQAEPRARPTAEQLHARLEECRRFC